MQEAITIDEVPDEQLVRELLGILGKEQCNETRSVIREAFGFDKSVQLTKVPVLMKLAIDVLIAWEYKQSKSKDFEHAKQIEKLEALKSSLEQTITLFDDSIVSDLLDHLAWEAEEDPKAELARNAQTYAGLISAHRRVSIALSNQLSGLKKMPLKVFYAYVGEVAKLYEAVSGKRFKHNRYGTTASQEFVACAVKHLNLNAKSRGCGYEYTDANESNACEEARKWLNSNREIK